MCIKQLKPLKRLAIAEYFRVLKPQGTLVINDSIQAGDRPALTPMVMGFPDMLHEPYYRNYLQDDVNERLAKAGFVNIRTEIHYFSKIWIAEKPLVLDHSNDDSTKIPEMFIKQCLEH